MGFSINVLNEEEMKAAIEEQVKTVDEELVKLQETADQKVVGFGKRF